MSLYTWLSGQMEGWHCYRYELDLSNPGCINWVSPSNRDRKRIQAYVEEILDKTHQDQIEIIVEEVLARLKQEENEFVPEEESEQIENGETN